MSWEWHFWHSMCGMGQSESLKSGVGRWSCLWGEWDEILMSLPTQTFLSFFDFYLCLCSAHFRMKAGLRCVQSCVAEGYE